jgi:hypothetical protein
MQSIKNILMTFKECKKRVESSSLCEHEGEVYCKNCHGKSFGPKGTISPFHGSGYGFGNAFLNSENTKIDTSTNYTMASTQSNKSITKSSSNPSIEASSVFSTGQRFSVGSGNPICPVCVKSVFFAEQVT